ncbi:MAG: hypothetical protein HZC28_00155 [Spirochaetes bacterium]|nr:hypothetical protein [Spirochaetota bacterium]
MTAPENDYPSIVRYSPCSVNGFCYDAAVLFSDELLPEKRQQAYRENRHRTCENDTNDAGFDCYAAETDVIAPLPPAGLGYARSIAIPRMFACSSPTAGQDSAGYIVKANALFFICFQASAYQKTQRRSSV